MKTERPWPIGVSVDATPEGYDNIRAFLIANNWDFSRCPLLPDFDMLAPISALPGVLHVTKLPARKYFEEIPSPPHVPGIDSPTSRNDGTPSSLGTGATAHGEQAWHDAGFDGTGVKIGIIDGSFLVITQPLPQGTCPTYRPRDACVVMPVQRTNATKERRIHANQTTTSIRHTFAVRLIVAIACAPAAPSGQNEEPTATPEPTANPEPKRVSKKGETRVKKCKRSRNGLT